MQDRYQEIYRGYRRQVPQRFKVTLRSITRRASPWARPCSPGAVILQVSRPRRLYL